MKSNEKAVMPRSRADRGRALFEAGHVILPPGNPNRFSRQLSEGRFEVLVRSEGDDQRFYKVNGRCGCPDYLRHGDGHVCKHMHALRIALEERQREFERDPVIQAADKLHAAKMAWRGGYDESSPEYHRYQAALAEYRRVAYPPEPDILDDDDFWQEVEACEPVSRDHLLPGANLPGGECPGGAGPHSIPVPRFNEEMAHAL